MTTRGFIAARFGFDATDLTLSTPHPVTTFTKLTDGRARGYGWSHPKWACDVCSRTGMGTSENPYQWAESCRRGHSPCPWCGTQLTVRKDGTPRVHSRCTARPDSAELLRLVAAEAKDVARFGVRGPMTRDASALLNRLTEGDRP